MRGGSMKTGMAKARMAGKVVTVTVAFLAGVFADSIFGRLTGGTWEGALLPHSRHSLASLFALPLSREDGPPRESRSFSSASSSLTSAPSFLPPSVPADQARRARSDLVAAIRANAPPDVRERCVRIVEGRDGSLRDSFAQAFQDWLLFHHFFSHVPYGAGSYIDLGSNHPVEFSNTYFFDRCLGWRGLCVEPNPNYHPLYASSNRTCTLVKNCIMDVEQIATMDFSDGLLGSVQSGDRELVSTDDSKLGENQVRCRPLAAILDEHRGSLGETIDLASLDIEGQEMTALSCFPFQKYAIRTWVVETNKAYQNLFNLFVIRGHAHVATIVEQAPEYENTTRVGRALDTVFRLIWPPLPMGPGYLPGKRLEGRFSQGACVEGSGDECAEQVPTIRDDMQTSC